LIVNTGFRLVLLLSICFCAGCASPQLNGLPYPREWPRIQQAHGGSCVPVDGSYSNEGIDSPGQNRGSRSPVRFHFDVTRGERPRPEPLFFTIEGAQDHSSQRFRFFREPGLAISDLTRKTVCKGNWHIFSSSGKLEGPDWRGTVSLYRELAVAEDGSLVAHTIETSDGSTLVVVPVHEKREYWFRFLPH
jgi:hypothetical protein